MLALLRDAIMALYVGCWHKLDEVHRRDADDAEEMLGKVVDVRTSRKLGENVHGDVGQAAGILVSPR